MPNGALKRAELDRRVRQLRAEGIDVVPRRERDQAILERDIANNQIVEAIAMLLEPDDSDYSVIRRTALQLLSGMAAAEPSDNPILERLGLRTIRSDEWTQIGTVTDQTPGQSPLRIGVEMKCVPGSCWRFTVDRATGQIVVTTQVGTFADYWPVIKVLAENLVTIETKPHAQDA